MARIQYLVATVRRALALRRTYGPDSETWLVPVEMSGFDTDNFLGVPQAFAGGVTSPPMRRGKKNHFVVLIELYILPRIRGENPFFVERIWDLMYRDNRKPVANGEPIATMAASVPPFHGLTGEEA